MTDTIRQRMSPVPLTRLAIDDVFWTPRQEANRTSTIPAVYEVWKKMGQAGAFQREWKPGLPERPDAGWELDVAKWIEAASYSLATHPDEELAGQLDRLIESMARAQQPDGFLSVYYTVVEPDPTRERLHMVLTTRSGLFRRMWDRRAGRRRTGHNGWVHPSVGRTAWSLPSSPRR